MIMVIISHHLFLAISKQQNQLLWCAPARIHFKSTTQALAIRYFVLRIYIYSPTHLHESK